MAVKGSYELLEIARINSATVTVPGSEIGLGAAGILHPAGIPPGPKTRGVKTSHRGWRQGDAEDASSQPQATHSLG
jgi:hypothetical protein